MPRMATPVVCDRCSRAEVLSGDAPTRELLFTAAFGGRTVMYYNLCSRCKRTINQCLDKICNCEVPALQRVLAEDRLKNHLRRG